MERSESIATLAGALSKVQSVLEPAKKDATNPFFKTQYADLASVWKACRKPLADNGLAVTQTLDIAEGGVVIETTLMHTSGEWIAGKLLIKPVEDKPQSVGSAITYARRYSLAAMVGVCPEDDDANEAMGHDKAKAVVAPLSPAKKVPEKAKEDKKTFITVEEQQLIEAAFETFDITRKDLCARLQVDSVARWIIEGQHSVDEVLAEIEKMAGEKEEKLI